MDKLIKSASAKRFEDGVYEISVTKVTDRQLALYWTKERDAYTKNRELISNNVEQVTRFKDPLNHGQRIYFIVESITGGEPYLFGERTLNIDGMTNLRDCGGYVGVNGRRIKWGMLYRSNHLHSVSPKSINYLTHLGIQTIVDFRSYNEITKSPNKYIGELITLHVDPSAHTAELAAQFAARPDNENEDLIQFVTKHIAKEKVNGNGEQVFEQYRNFVTGSSAKSAFKKMISVLLDDEHSPCVLHCRGGKDRTGYAVLLIMVMLGISENDIIDDYMLTHANRLARNEYKMSQYREITQDEDVLGYLLSLIDTREEFIVEALNAMKNIADTPENYIKQELGFSDHDFITIQNVFLE